ncbi:hypothetical protein E2C01_064411 [Portunus trituberculatus]|uniref:Uncharacterized protein n=1 Tax=Portunus trituberculatus TaxID=210409 RepID=A0A5B7HCY2_PORTR|nr:hypothetical protein [Portunus trituberculatus]
MYLPQPWKGVEAKQKEMVQLTQVRNMALLVVSFGPLKPLQIMLYLSKEIKHSSQMLVTPVTAPVGEKDRCKLRYDAGVVIWKTFKLIYSVKHFFSSN